VKHKQKEEHISEGGSKRKSARRGRR